MTSVSHAAVAPARTPVLPGVPILGSLPAIRRNILDTFVRAAKLGDVVRIQFPGRHGYLINHPDGIKRVFVDNHKNYGKQTRGYRMLRLALGDGLVTSEGELWRRQRRIAQPAFHHQRIAGFGKVMTDATTKVVEAWSTFAPKTVVELDEAMMKLTLEIVGRCLMSADLTDDSVVLGPSISVVLEETVRRIQNPLTLPLSVPTPSNRRYSRALAKLDDVIYGIIRARHESSGPAPSDLLTMFMEATDEETGERMNHKQLRDEVLTMVSAGHETTANALTWTFYLLSQHPEVLSRLRAELDEVLGERTPTIEDLPNLRYTDAVVKESMRVFPPVWMVARSANERDEILGHTITPGAMVFLNAYVSHRDPRYFEDPERFEPDRFFSGAMDSIPKYAYFPFAGGPRVCIGNNFALMEAKLLLAMIARRFDLTLVAGHRVEPQTTVTLRPKFGMPMAVSARDTR